MANPDTAVVEQPDYLNMSDEELMNAAPPTGVPIQEIEKPAAEEKEDLPESQEGKEDGSDEGGDKPPEEKTADDEEKDKAPAETKAPLDEKGEVSKDAPKETESKPEDKPKETAVIDYEAEYKKLLAPFKANGRDIQVDSVDDAVALMQMGANYNKKMAALKPNLKLMKMLENNGFLSEDKIGFLIDLGKKDPAAISKLVKDSGVDPMDLDADKASAYKQSTYAVDDREIELDTVLDELQGSPAYTRTLDVVSNKWDVASKQTVSQAPQLLKVLNDHMASGIYDLISAEIEKQRLFGRLAGLSDIEAYRQTGDAIQARGGFNHLVTHQGNVPPKQQEIVQPKAKVAEDEGLKDKRRAASSTKTAAPSTAPADFNPLALSDEEFSKMANKRF